MLDRLNEEIFEMKSRVREYERLKSSTASLQNELSQLVKSRGELLQKYEEELEDVENLEKAGVKSLFLAITGKKEEALDREKEELLRAKASYEECQTNIQELKKELAQAEILLSRFGDIEGDYHRLLKEKEELLIESGGHQGKALGENLIKADELEVDIKEVKEAIAAGRATLQSLEGVRERLDSAKGWGTWDLFGGGLISNIAKHSAIDEANSRARQVQHQLKTFRKELSDVNEFTDIEVNISAFASFADFFLDGLIADWFVQSRINDSIDHVEDAKINIRGLVEDLENRLEDLEKDLESTRGEIGEILQN